jgi:hypothetical protein
LRSDSLEILPKIISDTEEGLELYRQLLPEDVQKLNREYLNRAIRLRNGVDYSGSPLPHTLGVLPASFAYKSSVARDSVLQPASYTMPMSLGAPPAESDLPTRPETATRATIEELMERVLLRLSEPLRLDPVRLEVRLLDDRVIARRLDGNRSVEVDLSRGYRMVGYLSV